MNPSRRSLRAYVSKRRRQRQWWEEEKQFRNNQSSSTQSFKPKKGGIIKAKPTILARVPSVPNIGLFESYGSAPQSERVDAGRSTSEATDKTEGTNPSNGTNKVLGDCTPEALKDTVPSVAAPSLQTGGSTHSTALSREEII